MAGNIVREIDDWVKIKRVLISVSDKSGLKNLVPGLIDINPDIIFYSTGGTFKAIDSILADLDTENRLVQVSDYTGQPETQGGLVKTLDFKIYLGLLTETYNDAHRADLARTGAFPLDMVVVNLYPFEETVARRGVTVEEARSNIDIGGPCMIRASAKNYLRVAPVVEPADYEPLLAFMRNHEGKLNLKKRFELSCKAFEHTAGYDRAISAFLMAQEPDGVIETYELK